MHPYLAHMLAQEHIADLHAAAHRSRQPAADPLVPADACIAGPRAGAPGYPPLCVHGMNSLTDRRYALALARLRRG